MPTSSSARAPTARHRQRGVIHASDEEADAHLEGLRADLVLPFYLYEGSDFDDGSWFEPCARGLRGEGVTEDQYAGEHYFLRQVRQHRWRVTDPSRALLFIVPLYINAALQPSVAGTSCNGTHYQRLLDATAAAVARTEQYARHQGADHIIVCNSWKVAQKPPHQAPWSKQGQLPNQFFRHTFRNAIMGHMEIRHGHDTFGSFWRCSVVSPYTANYDPASDVHLRSPGSTERDVSFYFQGGANNRGTMGYAFRQAVLAQLEDFPRAHVSAFSLPGQPRDTAPCRGSLTTNCRAGRSNPAFRSLMGRAKFNLVLRGDSPSSRRLVDGIAAGSLSVLVSDQLWSVGLPFSCLVPWRKMAFTLRERPFQTLEGGAATLRALDGLSTPVLARMQRVANRHRRDLIWNHNESRVAENLLITAALRCLPTHTRRRGASSLALSKLKHLCPYGDQSIACRVTDESNCVGCETGDIAGGTLVEHCCGDSCPACNRTPSRCLPSDIYYGDPLSTDPMRRQGLQAYLDVREKDGPPSMQQWRRNAGKPRSFASPLARAQHSDKAKGDKAKSKAKSKGRGQ